MPVLTTRPLHCLPPLILAHMSHEASFCISITSDTQGMARPSLLPEGIPHHPCGDAIARKTNPRVWLMSACIRPGGSPRPMPTAAGRRSHHGLTAISSNSARMQHSTDNCTTASSRSAESADVSPDPSRATNQLRVCPISRRQSRSGRLTRRTDAAFQGGALPQRERRPGFLSKRLNSALS